MKMKHPSWTPEEQLKMKQHPAWTPEDHQQPTPVPVQDIPENYVKKESSIPYTIINNQIVHL